MAAKMFKLANFYRIALSFRAIRCGRNASVHEYHHFTPNVSNRRIERFMATAVHKYEDDVTHLKGPNNTTVNSIDETFSKIDYEVRRTGRIGRQIVENVFHQIKASGSVSSTHGLYLIRSCGRMQAEITSRKMDLVNEIWKTLQEFNTPMDSNHYNALLKIYIQSDVEFSPMEFLARMEGKNIEPNRITYQLFVEKFCNAGDLSGASVILEYMKEKEIPINEEIFNSLVKCHAKNNDIPGANDMLEAMRKSQLQPSAETYTVLACGYAEAGNIEAVNAALVKANDDGLRISNSNYCQLIISLAVGGQKQYINEIMKKLNFSEEYKHDYVSLIMDLIRKGFDDVAYEFVYLLGPHNLLSTTNLFIKHLTKTGKPIKTILGYCKDIQRNGPNHYIHLYAAKVAIDYHLMDHAIALLGEMQNQGIPVRAYHFYPIFEILRETNNIEGAWSTLKSMYKLGIPADFEIYCDCAHVAVNNNMAPRDILAKFEECGHSQTSALYPLFQSYCDASNLDGAAYLVENYQVRIGHNFSLKKLISSSDKYQDNPRTFFKILKYCMEDMRRYSGTADKILHGQILVQFMKHNSRLFERFLRMLVDENFKLNDESFNFVQNAFNTKAPGLLQLLQRLVDPNSRNELQTEQHSIEDNEIVKEKLEEYLLDLKKRGEFSGSALLKLLTLNIKMKNINRIQEILSELESEGFKLSAVTYAQLINMYAGICNLEMAEKLWNSAKQEHPDFILDVVKIVNYSIMLVRNCKYDEAVNIINQECKKSYSFGNNETLLKSLKRLLNLASETGEVALVRNLYNSIVENIKFVAQEKVLLEPLVRVYLVREDLQSAIDEYKNCVMKHQVFPCKYLLLRKCIFADDSHQLQRVIDLASEHVGESVALHELVLVLLELGRYGQAQNILQNLGRKTNNYYLEDICHNFFKQNKVSELKQFIHITQDLWHIDRDKLYFYLLQLYADKNDYINALQVWSSYEKEGIRPSAKTVKLLSELLKRNKQPLPLDFESLKEVSNSEDLQNNHLDDIDNEHVEPFLKCIEENQTAEAMELLKNMKKGHVRLIPLQFMSRLIDSLVQEKNIGELSQSVQAMSYIIEKPNDIVRPLLEQYSSAGDVGALSQIQNFVPDFVAKQISVNFYICKAYITSGRYDDLLLELEKRCDRKNKLFSVYAFQELLKISDLQERVLNLAQRYMDEIKFDLPLSVIWAHNFANENYTMADEFYKLNPISVEKVDSIIIKAIRNDKNVSLGRKYIDFLNKHDFKPRQKDRAYRSQLDILVADKMYEEALKLVEECNSQQVPLYKLSRTTLIALKNSLAEQNIEVSFTIPQENEDSDSSSESD